MATPTTTQVIEALGAPDAAKAWAKNIARWSYLYACRRPEITIELIDGKHTRRRRSLGMAKRVAEDWAGLLWTENAGVVAGGIPEQECLDRVFGSDFSERFATDVENAFAKGTGAIEILPNELTVDTATGELFFDETARLDLAYVPAECIIPLKWRRNEITEAAFVSWEGETVTVREHRGDDAVRTIKTRVFKAPDMSGVGKLIETPLPEEVIPELVLIDSPPMFVVLSPAIANNIDPESPFGISIYANAEDALDGVDESFDNFLEDIHLGGKMVFLPDTMLRKSTTLDPVTGKPKLIPPQADKRNLFVALDNATGEDQKIHEHNPDLRVADNKLAVETTLALVSSLCGMGEDRYTFTGTGVKTATEVISENSDLYLNRRKHLKKLISTLTRLSRAVLWAAREFLGERVDPDVEITVTSDDSVIEDDGSRQARGLAKVAAGVLSELTYLIDYEGYPEPEGYDRSAEAEIARIKSGRAATPLFG